MKGCKVSERTATSALEQHLVVETQAKLRHARQEHSHLDCTVDLTAKDLALSAD